MDDLPVVTCLFRNGRLLDSHSGNAGPDRAELMWKRRGLERYGTCQVDLPKSKVVIDFVAD